MLTDLQEACAVLLSMSRPATASFAAKAFIAVILAEIVYLLGACLGVGHYFLRSRLLPQALQPVSPMVSCIITCYSEGEGVQRTIESLVDQDYLGGIEVIAVVDGAPQNRETLRALRAALGMFGKPSLRALRILPKSTRGGRASSLNAGLAVARGQVVMALDGDTSFDRDMVRLAVRRMQEPGVVAVAGTLRVRNAEANLLTRLQALDYLIYRQFVRTALGEFNVVNNIPGAHGIFSADLLRLLGGWDTGSAEDVDMALRIKKLFGRYPALRIAADPHVISHTDVPEGWIDFLKQRLRWEGDPVYLFLRKHGPGLRPAVLGWRNFLFVTWYGLIFQILMPPTLLFSFLALAVLAAPHEVLAVSILGFGLYACAASVAYVLQLLLVSERPAADAGLAWLLPLYPPFVLLIRFWSALAVFHSLLLRSHLDTAMAPWWVLRKGKF